MRIWPLPILSGADLRHANLTAANLRLADLSGSNLSGADLAEVLDGMPEEVGRRGQQPKGEARRSWSSLLGLQDGSL